MPESHNLDVRIQKLEDIEAIKQLKYEYAEGCDLLACEKKIDQLLTKVDSRFDRLQNLISEKSCDSAVNRALLTIESASNNLKTNMKNAQRQRGFAGKNEVLKFFYASVQIKQTQQRKSIVFLPILSF